MLLTRLNRETKLTVPAGFRSVLREAGSYGLQICIGPADREDSLPPSTCSRTCGKGRAR